MMGQQRPTVAALTCLLGREVAVLARGDFEESDTVRARGLIFRRWVFNVIIPQILLEV